MSIAKTDRLTIRKMTEKDAGFILTLLNEPAFLAFIGDKGVRNLDDATEYLQNKVIKSYRTMGFGPYLVERRPHEPVGICSLKKRPSLELPDIGFAFLKQYRGNGYATEATHAVLHYASVSLGINKLAAIASPDNDASICLLKKVGFRFQQKIELPQHDGKINYYTAEL